MRKSDKKSPLWGALSSAHGVARANAQIRWGQRTLQLSTFKWRPRIFVNKPDRHGIFLTRPGCRSEIGGRLTQPPLQLRGKPKSAPCQRDVKAKSKKPPPLCRAAV